MLPSIYFTRPMPTDVAALTRVRVRAASVWGGVDSVIGGAAAGWWQGLLSDPPEIIRVEVPPARRLRPPPGCAVVRSILPAADVLVRSGIRIVATERAALDLAATDNTDLLDAMIRRGVFDPDALARSFDRGRGRRGWETARRALTESALRPFSYAERLLHRGLIAGSVGGWVANPSLVIAGVVVIPDVLFDDVPLVIEIDGRRHHTDFETFEKDRRRHNLLVAAGYTILRFTWRQLVTDPAGVIAQIVAIRARLGTNASGLLPQHSAR